LRSFGDFIEIIDCIDMNDFSSKFLCLYRNEWLLIEIIDFIEFIDFIEMIYFIDIITDTLEIITDFYSIHY